MAEPSGHTLFTEALRVITRAIDAHKDTSPWREIVAKTSGRRGPTELAVAIYAADPERIVDRYTIRAHEGRLEVVEHGGSETAIDWRVSIDHLRRVVAEADRYVEEPENLDLAWLESHLGIRTRTKRAAGWRVGRARRPS